MERPIQMNSAKTIAGNFPSFLSNPPGGGVGGGKENFLVVCTYQAKWGWAGVEVGQIK